MGESALDRIAVARFATPSIFAVLSLFFALRSLLSRETGGADTRTAQRIRVRLAIVFGLVSLFLFWFQSR